MKINKKFFYDNLTTIFYALFIAIIIRSLLFQPFYIPSSSMEPTLLVVTDFLFLNIHMVIVNILFHLVQNSQIIDFFLKNRSEVTLSSLKLRLTIELII